MKFTSRKNRIEVKEAKSVANQYKKKNRIKGESKKPKHKKIDF